MFVVLRSRPMYKTRCNHNPLQAHAATHMHGHGLLTVCALQAWLMQNDMDEEMIDEIGLEVPEEPKTWKSGVVDLVRLSKYAAWCLCCWRSSKKK
jgi:hypothetical protein